MTRLLSRAIPGADGALALCATSVLAAGTVLSLSGAAGGTPGVAIGGAILAATGLLVLLAAGLLSGPMVVALTAPLPALYASGGTRVATVAPVVALALLAWAIRRGLDGGPLRWGSIPRSAILALLAILALATAFAENTALSARETLNFALMLGLLVVCVDELSERPAVRATLVDLLVASAGICGVLAVAQAAGAIPSDFPRWGTSYHRASLGFGQPNGLGLFLAVLLPLAVHRIVISHGFARMAAVAATAAAGLGLVATFSRASWIAVVAGVGALVIAGKFRQALGVGMALVVAGVGVELATGILSDTATRTIGDWVLEQRAALFLAAVQMLLARPILGVGPGGFADQVEHFAARIPGLWDYQATPHNAYVQMAAETGVIGLLAFLLFLGACLTVLLRAVRHPASAVEQSLRLALLCSLVTVLVASMGIWPFAHGSGQVVVLVLALGFSETIPEAP